MCEATTDYVFPVPSLHKLKANWDSNTALVSFFKHFLDYVKNKISLSNLKRLYIFFMCLNFKLYTLNMYHKYANMCQARFKYMLPIRSDCDYRFSVFTDWTCIHGGFTQSFTLLETSEGRNEAFRSRIWINYDMIHWFEALKHTGWRHLLATAVNVTTLRPKIHESRDLLRTKSKCLTSTVNALLVAKSKRYNTIHRHSVLEKMIY